MASAPAVKKTLFKLQEIMSLGDGLYSVKLSRGGEIIASECNVVRTNSSKIGDFDVIQFKSNEFNRLCTSGDIYLKPISKTILCFHECILSELD